jgi:hypothetical protein
LHEGNSPGDYVIHRFQSPGESFATPTQLSRFGGKKNEIHQVTFRPGKQKTHCQNAL